MPHAEELDGCRAGPPGGWVGGKEVRAGRRVVEESMAENTRPEGLAA